MNPSSQRDYIDSMQKAIGVLDSLSSHAKSASASFGLVTSAAATGRQEFDKLAWSARNLPIAAIFKSIPPEVYAAKKAISDYSDEMERAAAVAKMLQIKTSLAFRTPLRDISSLSKEVKMFSDKLTVGFGGLKNFITSTGIQLTDTRTALLNFNRSVYDSVRMSDSLGRSGIFNKKVWDEVHRGTNLSKQDFASLYSTYLTLNRGIGMTTESFSKFTSTLTTKFGGGLDQIKDKFNVIMNIQSAVPDIIDRINKMNAEIAAGKKPEGLESLMLIAERFGGGTQAVQVLSQLMTGADDASKKLLEYQNSQARVQQSATDGITELGRQSEDAFIKVNKGMELATDKMFGFANATKTLPQAVVYFQQLSMAVGGLGYAAGGLQKLKGLIGLGGGIGPGAGGMLSKLPKSGKLGLFALGASAVAGTAAYFYNKSKKAGGLAGAAGGDAGAGIGGAAGGEIGVPGLGQAAGLSGGTPGGSAALTIGKQVAVGGANAITGSEAERILKMIDLSGTKAQIKTISTVSKEWGDASRNIAEQLKTIGAVGVGITESSKETYQASLLTYNAQSNLYDKAKDSLTQAFKTNDALSIAMAKSELITADLERRLALQKAVEDAIKKSSRENEASADFIKKQRDLLSSQADYVEKLALGMASSYEARKRVWEATVAERKELEKASVNMRDNLANEKMAVRFANDKKKTFAEIGVSQQNINRMARGEISAYYQSIDAINKKEGLNDTERKDAIQELTQKYGALRDMQKSIVDLKQTELEQTMKIREGYLDVINEMTTGNDLVSRLLPSMERGAMSILDIRRQMSGLDFGGAMRVGFASKQGFGAPGAAVMAPRYGRAGMEGSLANPAVAAYRSWQDQTRGVHEATQFGWGPGINMGQSNLGMTGFENTQMGPQARPFNFGLPPKMGGGMLGMFGNGGFSGKSMIDLTANGGRIPGPQGAGKDNMFAQIGKYFANGGATAMVGGGEWVVPKNRIRGAADLALLEAANGMGKVGSVNKDIYNKSYAAASSNPLGARISEGSYIVNNAASNIPGMSGALAGFNSGDPSGLQQMVGMNLRGGPLKMFLNKGLVEEGAEFISGYVPSAISMGINALKGRKSGLVNVPGRGNVFMPLKDAAKLKGSSHFGKFMKGAGQFTSGASAAALVNHAIDSTGTSKYNIPIYNRVNSIIDEVERCTTKEGASAVIRQYLNEAKVAKAQAHEQSYGRASNLGKKVLSTAAISLTAVLAGKPLFGLGYASESLYDSLKNLRSNSSSIGELLSEVSDTDMSPVRLMKIWEKKNDKGIRIEQTKEILKKRGLEKQKSEILQRYNSNKDWAQKNKMVFDAGGGSNDFQKAEYLPKFLESINKQNPSMDRDLQKMIAESMYMESVKRRTDNVLFDVRRNIGQSIDAGSRGAGGIKGGKSVSEIYQDRAKKALRKVGIVDPSIQEIMIKEIEQNMRSQNADKAMASLAGLTPERFAEMQRTGSGKNVVTGKKFQTAGIDFAVGKYKEAEKNNDENSKSIWFKAIKEDFERQGKFDRRTQAHLYRESSRRIGAPLEGPVNQYRGNFSAQDEQLMLARLAYDSAQRKKKAYAPDENMMSGGALGASLGSSSNGSSAVSKASLYLTGGINVDRLYLGGQMVGQRMKSDNANFWKALEMQVIG